jgi:hypothetical protein
MGDFVLISCKDKKTGSIADKLSRLFKRTDFNDLIDIIDVYDNVRCYSITLPCDKKGTPAVNIKKFEKFLDKFNSENNIISYVVPESLGESIKLEGRFQSEYARKLVFKSLINIVIDKAFACEGNGNQSPGVCIAQGDNEVELYELIRFLSNTVKFFTVLTPEKNSIEKGINEIYDECGLSIAVTDDLRSALKDCSVLINLGKLNELCISKAYGKNNLVINLGTISSYKIPDSCRVINGINIGMPVHIRHMFSKAVYNSYSESQIAHILLFQRVEAVRAQRGEMTGSELLGKTEQEFKRAGLSISSFEGLHGIICF